MADPLGARLEYNETETLCVGEVAREWFGHGREVFCGEYTA